jgi:hypothetical protein
LCFGGLFKTYKYACVQIHLTALGNFIFSSLKDRGVVSVTHLRTCVTMIQENKNSNILKTLRKLKGMDDVGVGRLRGMIRNF